MYIFFPRPQPVSPMYIKKVYYCCTLRNVVALLLFAHIPCVVRDNPVLKFVNFVGPILRFTLAYARERIRHLIVLQSRNSF